MRNMLQRNIMKRLFILFSAITLISCSYTTVRFTLDRPAEVNFEGHPKIAITNVEPFSNSTHHKMNAKKIGDRIRVELIQTQQFDILDRQHFESLLSEQKLSLSGLMNENSTVKQGNFTGATILLQCSINKDSYNETYTKEKFYIENFIPHKYQNRYGKYSLSITFKFIDIETSELLSIFTLSHVSDITTRADWTEAPAIVSEDLYERSFEKVINKFVSKVNPTSKTLKLKFETDDDLSEINQAITYLRIGEIEKGLRILENLRKRQNLKSKIRAIIEYDIGLTQLMLMRYDLAIESYKQAIKLNPSNNRYHKALQNAKYEAEMAKEINTSGN